MLTSCHTCGLVIEITESDGERTACPRCSATLFKRDGGTLYSLFFSITALILLVPAATYPFISIRINEDTTSATILDTAYIMIHDGFGIAGILVLFTALIFPMAYLLVMTYISLSCVTRTDLPYKWFFVRIMNVFEYFQMTDVFIVGILVSIVKLIDMADVSLEKGFYLMIVMTGMLVAAGAFYDKHLYWCRRHNGK
jgi:paraquat-inducible protein A